MIDLQKMPVTRGGILGRIRHKYEASLVCMYLGLEYEETLQFVLQYFPESYYAIRYHNFGNEKGTRKVVVFTTAGLAKLKIYQRLILAGKVPTERKVFPELFEKPVVRPHYKGTEDERQELSALERERRRLQKVKAAAIEYSRHLEPGASEQLRKARGGRFLDLGDSDDS